MFNRVAKCLQRDLLSAGTLDARDKVGTSFGIDGSLASMSGNNILHGQPDNDCNDGGVFVVYMKLMPVRRNEQVARRRREANRQQEQSKY